jgi:UDPglucose 6-dehydrogenase
VNVGIIGYGIVGQATARLFGEYVIYDPPKGHSDASLLCDCRVIFMTVPTPTMADGRCDLSALDEAAGSVAGLLSDRQVVAVRSTVTPGTVRQLQEQFPNTHFASNPEFLRAHRASEDALRPARVVIGADSVFARQTLLGAYYSRLGRDIPYLVTDSLTAEFIKYAANCFLATKITYAAEIRRAAEAVGARYADAVKALALDPRIGDGEEWWIGQVADECLPKDLDAFVHLLGDWKSDHRLLNRVLEINDRAAKAADRVEPERDGGRSTRAIRRWLAQAQSRARSRTARL